MDIDAKMRKEEAKLKELKHEKFEHQLAGNYVIFAGVYTKWDSNKADYDYCYNYYINPDSALTACHKHAQHLIDMGIHVKPFKQYAPYSFHSIRWGLINHTPVSSACFLFTKQEADNFAKLSPYPKVLKQAIIPASDAKPNNLFFKASNNHWQRSHHPIHLENKY